MSVTGESWRNVGIAVLVCALLAAACGTDTTEDTVPSATITTRETQATTTTAATTSSAAPKVAKNISFTVDTQLDVYAPSEPGPWPVVVVVHGYAQDKSSNRYLAEALASQGAVVFNINATMSVPFLTAIEQVACAVRFARATAPDYGGDPTRITLVGNSTGASSGAVVALAGDDYEEDCVVAEVSALPNALVGYEGPYDWAIRDGFNVNVNVFHLREEDPDLWEAINPYSLLGRNPDLVVRLIHGDRTSDDRPFPPLEVSVEFHQALVGAGYDAELTVVEGAGHDDLSFGPFAPSPALEVTVEQVLQAARG